MTAGRMHKPGPRWPYAVLAEVPDSDCQRVWCASLLSTDLDRGNTVFIRLVFRVVFRVVLPTLLSEYKMSACRRRRAREQEQKKADEAAEILSERYADKQREQAG